jgi:hypothetical protein
MPELVMSKVVFTLHVNPLAIKVQLYNIYYYIKLRVVKNTFDYSQYIENKVGETTTELQQHEILEMKKE